jgi:hypothetical protein
MIGRGPAASSLRDAARSLRRADGVLADRPRRRPGTACALSRVKGERGRVQVRRRPTVSALSGRCPFAEWTITRLSPLLIEPDVRFSRIRLSDGFHTRACAGGPR